MTDQNERNTEFYLADIFKRLDALEAEVGNHRLSIKELERRDLPVGPTRNAQWPQSMAGVPVRDVQTVTTAGAEPVDYDKAKQAEQATQLMHAYRNQPDVEDKLEEMRKTPVGNLDMQTALEMITKDRTLKATWGKLDIWLMLDAHQRLFSDLKGFRVSLSADMLASTWRVERR